IVMRVFPVVGITAPRLPLEKSYTFFIIPSLLRISLPHRYDAHSASPGSVNQRPEQVHSDGHEAMLAYIGVIFDGYRERVIQHPIALGKRYAVLLDVCCVLLRIEFGGRASSICTICISVNAAHRRLGDLRWAHPHNGYRIHFLSRVLWSPLKRGACQPIPRVSNMRNT